MAIRHLQKFKGRESFPADLSDQPELYRTLRDECYADLAALPEVPEELLILDFDPWPCSGLWKRRLNSVRKRRRFTPRDLAKATIKRAKNGPRR